MNKVQKENLEKGLAAYRKEPALCIELLTPLLNTDLSDEDRGRVVYALGNACFISAENTKAMEYLMEALHYYNSHNNREMLPHIKSLIGVLFMNQGNLSGSMDAFEEELLSAEKENNYNGIFKGSTHLGQTLFLGAQYEDGVRYMRHAADTLDAHPEILHQTESIPIYYGFHVIAESGLKNLDEAAVIRQKMKKVIGLYPRFAGGPYELVADLYYAVSHGDDYEELLRKIIRACIQVQHNAGEYLPLFVALIRLLIELNRPDVLSEILPVFSGILDGTDYYQYMMVVSRGRQLCLKDAGKLDEFVKEVEHFWKLSDLNDVTHGKLARYYMAMRSELVKSGEEINNLSQQVNIDELTGVDNRRALNQKMVQWFEKAGNDQCSLGIEIMDIDSFKHINDTYGHRAGDVCLKTLGNVLQDVEKENDNIFCARYGSDEFAILYLNQRDEDIMKTARRIKEKVRQACTKEECILMHVSQGIFQAVPDAHDKEWTFVALADEAMYEAKKERAGKICFRTRESQTLTD